MSNTRILVTALLTYLAVCVVGGGIYYYYSMMMPPPPSQEEAAGPPGAAPPEEPQPGPEETPEEKAKRLEAAAKEAEAQKAKEKERQQARLEAIKREAEMDKLESGMLKQKNGSVTIYSYPKSDQPPTGLYLRPSLAVGHRARLQYEIYYYYNIDDGGGQAWIFGDHFVIKAGGKHYDLPLNPDKRQKDIATDAQWLSERYTGVADASWQEALHAVASAGYGTMTYYQQGGKSVSAEFSGKAYQQIKDMVALYDLMFEQQSAKEQEE